jgi:hypothetical protein
MSFRSFKSRVGYHLLITMFSQSKEQPAVGGDYANQDIDDTQDVSIVARRKRCWRIYRCFECALTHQKMFNVVALINHLASSHSGGGSYWHTSFLYDTDWDGYHCDDFFVDIVICCWNKIKRVREIQVQTLIDCWRMIMEKRTKSRANKQIACEPIYMQLGRVRCSGHSER